MKTVLVGRGRVGRGLHKLARIETGEWRLTSGHRPSKKLVAAADTVVLAVPDPHIRDVAARIAPWLRRGACVLHCAGSRTAVELEACARAGARTGAMHPLASFADPARPPNLHGAFFVSSGDARAVKAARNIARAVGATVLALPLHGPAYHALAAMIAGGTVGFVYATIPALQDMGLGRRDAERAAGSLVRTVAENIIRIGLPKALTGPVIRGDAATVAAHRNSLSDLSEDVAAAYDAVAPLVLECAIAAGLSKADTRRIRKVLRNG
jgi:predicted short-subunit dehydrogenase-like oxidoreductase (DUF2520 family)